ncbi:MAG: FkbM family methyltransferase [Terracidiphilus sp.]|jgi:FkbM family methyltransferase
MKRTIQFIANALGYEVHSLFSSSSVGIQRSRIMDRLAINFVFDIGANTGQYALDLRRFGYKQRICSYEPQHRAFSVLQKAAVNDEQWKVVNSACGPKSGKAVIHVSKNSFSSSLLPILDAHLRNSENSRYVSREEISVCSLDEDVNPGLTDSDKVWLKIDTQGYEAAVLEGAAEVLRHASAVECELSMVPLYRGQPLIGDMIGLLYRSGFRPVHLTPGFSERDTGYTLQMDGIFLRM